MAQDLSDPSAVPPSYDELFGIVRRPGQPTALPATSTPAPCCHYVALGCKLTNDLRQCCSCMDLRGATEDGLYETYGAGRREKCRKKKRWDYYCNACKSSYDGWNQLMTFRRTPDSGRSAGGMSGPKKWAAAVFFAEIEPALPLYDEPGRERVWAAHHTLFAAAAAAKQATTTPMPTMRGVAQCLHWSMLYCRLTSSRLHCCACMDTRPLSADGLYDHYHDGGGVLRTASRYELYCPGCKGWFTRYAKNADRWARADAKQQPQQRAKALQTRSRQQPAATHAPRQMPRTQLQKQEKQSKEEGVADNEGKKKNQEIQKPQPQPQSHPKLQTQQDDYEIIDYIPSSSWRKYEGEAAETPKQSLFARLLGRRRKPSSTD